MCQPVRLRLHVSPKDLLQRPWLARRPASLLFNLGFPRANRLTPLDEGLCISTRPQKPQPGALVAHSARPRIAFLEQSAYHQQKPYLSKTPASHMLAQWAGGTDDQRGRKKERRVGGREGERERGSSQINRPQRLNS